MFTGDDEDALRARERVHVFCPCMRVCLCMSVCARVRTFVPSRVRVRVCVCGSGRCGGDGPAQQEHIENRGAEAPRRRK
jgi:hypothetical protein